MIQIKFKAPGGDEPGYLLRVRKSLAFRSSLNSENPTVETVDALVDFLVEYVTEPADRDAAKDALLNASQEQFNQLLQAVVAENEPSPT